MNENDELDLPRPARDHNNKKRKPALPENEERHPLHQPYRRPTRKDWYAPDEEHNEDDLSIL